MIEHENELNFLNREARTMIWDNNADGQNWYLEFFIEKNVVKTVRSDHLEQMPTNNRNNWKSPRSDVIQDMKLIQIIRCAIMKNEICKKTSLIQSESVTFMKRTLENFE